MFWYNEADAYFGLPLDFVTFKLRITRVFMFKKYVCTKSLTHSSLSFLYESGDYLFMDKSICSRWCGISLEQVSAIDIHKSAHCKQTGQGQLCFPLEKCIIQRKGRRCSGTLMTQSTVPLHGTTDLNSVFSLSQNTKTESICSFIPCEKPDLLKW